MWDALTHSGALSLKPATLLIGLIKCKAGPAMANP